MFLSYDSPAWQVQLGDRNYGLSPLTSYYQYGRGVGVGYRSPHQRWTVGGYYVDDRWGVPDNQEYGAYVGYAFSEQYRVRANLLRQDHQAGVGLTAFDDTYVSLEAEARPLPEMRLQAEYALGYSSRAGNLDDDAWRAEMDGRFGKDGYYHLTWFHASPDYYGYYTDSDHVHASLSHSLAPRLRGRLTFNDYAGNLQIRPAKITAPRETLWQAALDYSLAGGWTVGLGYDDFRRSDRLLPVGFRERAVRASGGWSNREFGLRAEVRVGDLRDTVVGLSRTGWSTTFFGAWTPDANTNFTVYGGFSDDDSITGSRLLGGSNNLGAAVYWKPKPNLDLQFWYDKYNYLAPDRPQSNQYRLSLHQEFSTRHRLGFDIRHNTQDLVGDQTSYMVTYSVPIDLPVAKRRNIGEVRGRILDGEAPGLPGQPNAVVWIGSATAVSDAQGRFIFPALPPGRHALRLERSSIGLDRVAVTRMPLEVSVAVGQVSEVELQIVRSATLAGNVTLMPPAPRAANGNGPNGAPPTTVAGDPPGGLRLTEPTAWPNVLLEMSQDDEVVRRVTDAKGKFVFDGLRPGRWHLRVYDHNLPASYQLPIPEQELELAAGQRLDLSILATPRERPIQWIDGGAIPAPQP